MPPIGGDERHPDRGATMGVEMVDLCDRHRETSFALGDQRADKRAFRLERVHVTEQEVEFSDTNPHRDSCYAGAIGSVTGNFWSVAGLHQSLGPMSSAT